MWQAARLPERGAGRAQDTVATAWYVFEALAIDNRDGIAASSDKTRLFQTLHFMDNSGAPHRDRTAESFGRRLDGVRAEAVTGDKQPSRKTLTQTMPRVAGH
jgi:hypothetical protein